MELTEQQKEALRLLGVYTGGKFRISLLTGYTKLSARVHLMRALTGDEKYPAAKCGITEVRKSFLNLAGAHGVNTDCCQAQQDHNFTAWALCGFKTGN